MSAAFAGVMAIGLTVAWGVWWAGFPDSVIRFYHRFWSAAGVTAPPLPRALVRGFGLLWLLVVVSIFIIAWRMQSPPGSG